MTPSKAGAVQVGKNCNATEGTWYLLCGGHQRRLSLTTAFRDTVVSCSTGTKTINNLSLFFFIFQTCFQLLCFRLTIYPRLASGRASCLSLPSAVIIGTFQYVQLKLALKVFLMGWRDGVGSQEEVLDCFSKYVRWPTVTCNSSARYPLDTVGTSTHVHMFTQRQRHDI